MKANEVIDCILREDGLHVIAYRHQDACVACCVSFEKQSMSIGEISFADEQELKQYAKDKLLPWINKLNNRFDGIEVSIIPSICEMSIGTELPMRMS